MDNVLTESDIHNQQGYSVLFPVSICWFSVSSPVNFGLPKLIHGFESRLCIGNALGALKVFDYFFVGYKNGKIYTFGPLLTFLIWLTFYRSLRRNEYDVDDCWLAIATLGSLIFILCFTPRYISRWKKWDQKWNKMSRIQVSMKISWNRKIDHFLMKHL